MRFICSTCNREYPIEGLDYECYCGGLFHLQQEEAEVVGTSISLGEVKTPIIQRKLGNIDAHLKLDYMMPTGSFKDRGAFAMINMLKELGITEVVEDSSGNAGAAIAGYCAAAGIACHIYLPESTSPGKIKQINAYGANIVKVPGTRQDTFNAIRKAAETIYYASHVYNPLFFEGTKSLAYEIHAQMGVPDDIFVPAGNGTMLLGIYLGFKEIGKLPRIIAVQSEYCAPIYQCFHNLRMDECKNTIAEGIAVQYPRRIDEMVAAVRESQGDVLTVSDDVVVGAQHMLGKMGIYVEPTAGVAVAGALQYFTNKTQGDRRIVIPLTGAGLKK